MKVRSKRVRGEEILFGESLLLRMFEAGSVEILGHEVEEGSVLCIRDGDVSYPPIPQVRMATGIRTNGRCVYLTGEHR